MLISMNCGFACLIVLFKTSFVNLYSCNSAFFVTHRIKVSDQNTQRIELAANFPDSFYKTKLDQVGGIISLTGKF
jgi:hypothetical protein